MGRAVFAIVLLQCLSVFAYSSGVSSPSCKSGPGFQDCTYVYSAYEIPVKFRLYGASGKFDPKKPTIIYVPGGPVPISQRVMRTSLFPKADQVIIVDTIGTSRRKNSLPNLSNLPPGQISKLFSSDKQASVLANIIKSQNLSKYIIWGESNGVQISMRLIDKLQRDGSIVAKPIAAFLDSGSGRQISETDARAKLKKCGSNFQPILKNRSHRQPRSRQSLDPNIATYLGSCYTRGEAQNSATLVRFIEDMKRQMQAHGAPFTARVIQNQIGCPPVGKINYFTWGWAMRCGMFNSVTLKQNAPPCPGCGAQTCHDSKLDVRHYKVGDTAIFGIQAADDCVNWTTTMDYLMKNLCKSPGPNCMRAKSEYLNGKVIPYGGHVVSRSFNFRNCSVGKPRDEIFSDLFKADLKAEAKTIINCYNDSPNTDIDKQVSSSPTASTK